MLTATLRTTAKPERLLAAGVLHLRLFLGATNLYAGLTKLGDPQFFDPAAPGYIGRQMQGYVQGGSPLTPLLTSVGIPHASLVGALIALGEVCVGLAVLAGLFGRAAVTGGLLISLTLYLTASWDVRPYFLGNDLPYAVGWLTLLLAGLRPYQLDRALVRRITPAGAAHGHAPRSTAEGSPEVFAPVASRADFLRRLGAAVAVVALGGLLGSLARWRAAASTPPQAMATRRGATGSSAPVAIGSVATMPVNSARPFTVPGAQGPALLIHLADGRFVTYDAACTHQGCPVQYDPQRKVLACPCHGSVFDPANGAKVLQGPAPRPLAALRLTVDANGQASALAPGRERGA